MGSANGTVINFLQNLFSPLTSVLGGAMQFFHNSLGVEWWIAIALLTIAVRTLLFPLTVKQVRSMRAMQEIQPEIKKLQGKHQNDRQKLQEEQMKLFQERGVNPLGGCLPLLIQLPIFIGIFYTIRKFGGTEGMIGIPDHPGTIPGFDTGGILWFTDLGASDPLHILPVLSAVTMLASMELTSKSAQPQMKWVMRIMPIAFLALTIFFPAGLLIYIVTTNLMTLAQNYIIYNLLPDKKTPSSSENSEPASANTGASAAKAVENGSGAGNSPNGQQRSTRAVNRSSKKKKSRKKK